VAAGGDTGGAKSWGGGGGGGVGGGVTVSGWSVCFEGSLGFRKGGSVLWRGEAERFREEREGCEG